MISSLIKRDIELVTNTVKVIKSIYNAVNLYFKGNKFLQNTDRIFHSWKNRLFKSTFPAGITKSLAGKTSAVELKEYNSQKWTCTDYFFTKENQIE